MEPKRRAKKKGAEVPQIQICIFDEWTLEILLDMVRETHSTKPPGRVKLVISNIPQKP